LILEVKLLETLSDYFLDEKRSSRKKIILGKGKRLRAQKISHKFFSDHFEASR
jgi:hypothetical protein